MTSSVHEVACVSSLSGAAAPHGILAMPSGHPIVSPEDESTMCPFAAIAAAIDAGAINSEK